MATELIALSALSHGVPLAVYTASLAQQLNAPSPGCTERLHQNRSCADCMSSDHGGSGQAFLMCISQGYDCHCSAPDTSMPPKRVLQRGLGRAAWKRGDDANAAYQRLLSHRMYMPSALRTSPEPGRGGGSWIVQYDKYASLTLTHSSHPDPRSSLISSVRAPLCAVSRRPTRRARSSRRRTAPVGCG